ncbi:hypothetical protein J6590_090028 [Homalodisca vitripennis]|nr:hypothetical protein J6590_090028 [Homalodisca vitripennis]
MSENSQKDIKELKKEVLELREEIVEARKEIGMLKELLRRELEKHKSMMKTKQKANGA